MSYVFVQPNGLLGVFSTICDHVMCINGTRAELLEYFADDMGRRDAVRKVRRGLIDKPPQIHPRHDSLHTEDLSPEADPPLPTTLVRWEEVLSTLKFRHGKAVRDLVRNACTGPRGNAAERELCGIEAEDEEPEEAKMDAKTDEMQPASAELLPCPFCGSDAEVEPYPPGLEPVHSWQGECTVCAATGPSGTTAAHAAEGWNRYSDHDIFVQLRREVAALKGVPAHELELGPRWKRVGGEYRRDFGAGFGAPNSGVLAVRWDWNERPPDKWTVLLFSAVVSHECPEPQSNFATFNEAVQHCEAWLVEHQLEAKKEVQR